MKGEVRKKGKVKGGEGEGEKEEVWRGRFPPTPETFLQHHLRSISDFMFT